MKKLSQSQERRLRMAELMRQQVIVRKVKKLLALSAENSGATEAEKETAWQMATAMMKRNADIFERSNHGAKETV